MRNSHYWSDAEQSLLAQGAHARVSEKQALHRQLFSGKEHMSDGNHSDLEVWMWSEGCKKKNTRPTKELRFSQINLRCPNRW